MDQATSDISTPRQRQAALAAERDRKMAASAHAYERGSAARFYDWLKRSERGAIPHGPDIWICGDCHVGNLGPVASADEELEIQIRDLDQAVIGNPAHDLIRLGLSLAMAARSSDLPGLTITQLLEHLMAGYEAALLATDTDLLDRVRLPSAIKQVMRVAAGRSWKTLADERIDGTEPTIPLGKRLWPLEARERTAIEKLIAQEDLRNLATKLRSRDEHAEIKVLDAAYWRKGCSSLGRLRYAVLVGIIGDRDRDTRHCLLDVKEATAAAAPRSVDAVMPRDNARRVVEGACHLSPFLGERMVAARLLDRAVVVRELLPQDLKLELKHPSADETRHVAEFLATVVGRAHARQMDAATRASWLAKLLQARSKSLDAPSWLWSGVVDLIGIHETAYLDHCRRHALALKAGSG